MIRLLVSVRSVAEALVAAGGGADFIDLKEPARGALGGLPVATVRAIVDALRDRRIVLPVSATIGDLDMGSGDAILARVDAVGNCGVRYVKVGIEREPGAAAVLDRLAQCRWPVIPVFIADRGLDDALVDRALGHGFPGVMIDTADKRAGSLFDLLPRPAIEAFIARARGAGTMVGIAGALRVGDAAVLAALRPDFAGFRSAVCDGDRAGTLQASRLDDLATAMATAMSVAKTGHAAASSADQPQFAQ
jgi:uncharacterized protein (UPF0264 family)